MKTNKVIVIDLEATCWDDQRPDVYGEIIEIGICLLGDGEITRKQSFYVRPKNLPLSSFCTNLTGITTETLKTKGSRFDFVLNRIAKEYPLRTASWCSWGNDNILIEDACKQYGVKNPFVSHFDLAVLFRILFGLKKVSVSHALELLNLEFEGRRHSGADDAYNTARILKELSKRIRNV